MSFLNAATRSSQDKRSVAPSVACGKPIKRPADVLLFESRAVRVGTFDHWSLMEQACRAKFEQHAAARAALLATAPRPLAHKMRRDSRTIPAVIMAEIWMRIRRG